MRKRRKVGTFVNPFGDRELNVNHRIMSRAVNETGRIIIDLDRTLEKYGIPKDFLEKETGRGQSRI